MTRSLRAVVIGFFVVLQAMVSTAAHATPYTMTVPGTGVALPDVYPEAGGVAIVLTGANGNLYYQFSDPAGAFVGFQNSGQPAAFRGNPFTINNPLTLDCGVRDCSDYFGGSIARMDVRFSAFDGDTQVGGFDYQDISLILNGTNVGNWSDRTSQVTNNAGTSSIGANNGFVNGFGNGTFNTSWFASTDTTLLGNILTTGQMTTQVFDSDPDDNYWDFRRGNSLANDDLRKIAPGYELEKSRDIADTTFATVDQVIEYEYVVRNIGSVDIDNIVVTDDKIVAPNTLSCDRTSLPKTVGGGTPEEALCTASYVVTQEDIERGTLTNVATATGDPEYGNLGALTAQVTLTGPAIQNNLVLEKIATPSTFTAVGQVINYELTVRNEGNVTLTNVVVTDPMFPTLNCSVPSLVPLSSTNTVNEASCTASYTIRQIDIDNADAGTALVNTANATGRDTNNTLVNAPQAQATVTGPDSVPSMTVTKRATTATYAAVGDEIDFEIEVTNTGNVTWPTAPTITDALTGGATCPAGPVAPGASVVCTASYTVDQDDLDDEKVTNVASASVTVNGQTATNGDTVEVDATVTPELTLEKALTSGSPDPYSATTDELFYTYTLTNDGNVLLQNITLTDDKVSLSCPATQLAAGLSMVCTSVAYDVMQADLDAGSVTNIATANAQTKQGDAIDAVMATLTVDADQAPAMSMAKTAETISAADFVPYNAATGAGTVDYTYVVTNTGNVTLTDPIQIIDDKFTDPIDCPAGALAPTAQVTCTATYQITTTDVADGFVTNTAKAKSGATESNEDQATIPQSGTPEITLVKEATDAAGVVLPNPTFSSLGDTLYYKFTATNTGDVTWSRGGGALDRNERIRIDDSSVATSSVNCTQPSPGLIFTVQSNLLPNSVECTASFSGLTQADIDAGEYVNTATARFNYRDGPAASVIVRSNPDSATHTLDITPGFTFVKDAPSPATFSALNEPVTFTFTATNTSVQTVAEVVVTDPDIPTLNCTLGPLGPVGSATQSDSCTGTYLISQDDMDAGTFTNTASATGTTSTGDPIAEVTDTATVTLPAADRNESLTLDKIASTDTYAAVGDTIDYTFSVFNDGNVTLSNITVTDSVLGFSCQIASLAVGQTDTSCTATKTIEQADIDAGTFVNNASASTAGGASDTDAETATGPTRAPAMTLDKASGDTFGADNDPVTFTFTVTNTGNVTLTNVVVTDSFFTPALNCTIGTLLPMTSDSTTCSATYLVDQAEVDAGSITNTASVAADSPLGALTPVTDTEVVLAEPEDASFVLAKTEDDMTTDFGGVGATEGYTISITNTGNVTLKGITIEDPLTGLDCAVDDIIPGGVATACSGGSPSFSSIYTIDQDDVDAGSLTNTVTVNATTTQGTALTDTKTVILQGPDQLPAISMTKTATSGANYSAIGDTVTYDYVVSNTGNITLTAPITVADDRVTVTCPDLPAAGLAPTQSITCTATHTVDQDDLDAGAIVNKATANISQPVVPNTTYPLGTADVSSAEQTETVSANQLPALTIAKAIKADTPSTYSATTDTVMFEFTVTNSGNVTTTGQITVQDTFPVDGVSTQVDIPCGPATGGIAPGDTVLCSYNWTPVQSDIDNGSITNSSTASMPFAGGTTATGTPSTATAYAIQEPRMTIEKTYRDGSLADFASNEVASYDYLITNTGNETIVGPITIEDNLIAAVDCSSFTGDLPPGGTMTCEGDYTVNVDDVKLGSAVNVAKAVSVTVESETTSETIPSDGVPAISITKAAAETTFEKAGDKINYTYTVTNTSTGSTRPAFANDIYIQDDKFPSDILCWTTSDDDPDIRVGETVSCTAEYTVTQADMDAIETPSDGSAVVTAFVKNTANAMTTFGVAQVVSEPKSVTVVGNPQPSLLVEKTATSTDNPAVEGSTVNYSITVTNDGDQTISGILVEDPMLPALSCEMPVGTAAPANLVLAPSQFAVCTGSYIVQQSDVDAQILENTATATGSDPTGAPISRTGETTYPIDPFDPGIDIEKTLASGSLATAFTDPGQQLTFAIAVENTGNITLSTVTVTDILLPGESCEIRDLLPGITDSTTCEFVYTVQQSDIDRGFFENRATAEGQPATPGSETVQDSDVIRGEGPEREPSMAMGKSIVSIGGDTTATTFDATNVPIVYSYTVVNTGNVTITQAPAIVDDKILAPNSVTCETFPAEGLEPSGEYLCEATYLTTQTDMDAGEVTNVAVATAPNPVPGQPDLTATDSETADAVQTSGLTVSKVASDDTDVVLGQMITYTYTVENVGTVTLTNVTLTDAHTTQAGTSNLTIADSPIASLAPRTPVTLTATYTVTQDDINANQDITNTVTVTGTPPAGAPFVDPVTASEVVETAAPAPALEVIKTANAIPPNPVAGTTVSFTVTVENTGNVDLQDVALADTMTRIDTTPISPAPAPQYVSGDTDNIGILDEDETWTYSVTYALTQGDIDAGGIRNSVKATAQDQLGNPAQDVSDTGSGNGSTPTPLLIAANPSVEAAKRITEGPVTLGSTVRFEIDVKNTGNVTLNSVTVVDSAFMRADGTALTLTSGPDFNRADMGSGAGSLQVGETATYVASYVLVQEDIDAGGIENSARVAASPPVGSPVTDDVDEPVELPIAADPSIDMVKSLLTGGPTFRAVGDLLTFEFEITNTGNVTLIDDFSIDDPMITDAGGTIVCQDPPLAPLASLTCQGSYSVTQQDLNNGTIENTATASTTGAVSDPSTEIVPALQDPSLETVKEGTSVTVDGVTYDTIESQYFVTGAVVNYTFTVTNTGNVTLTDQIEVSDNRIASVTCPPMPAGGLVPTASLVCEADYTVTATDVELASVTNAATATSGDVTAPIVTETIPADGVPLLSVVKSLGKINNPDGSEDASGEFDEVGDVLTYSFEVTNDGDVAFARNVTIEDALLGGSLVCFAPTPDDPDFRSGEVTTCEGTYTITQDDLDAGEVFNEALAQTLFGLDETPVISNPSTVTTPADQAPSLEIEKTAATLPISGVGQVLTYTLTVNNVGNQTLSFIRVSDPLIPDLSCSIADLAPDTSGSCQGTYTVTQADFDAGEVVNTASASAITPSGDQVSDETSLTLDTPAPFIDLRLAKTANPDPFGAVGSSVTYSFTAENRSNVTLFDVVVTDEIVSPTYACTIPRLDVGATDSNCFLTYTVTQEDVDAGEIVNRADVVAEDPFGTATPQVSATNTLVSQTPVPSIEATKTATLAGTAVDSVVTFNLSVRNTGDVSMTIGTITDTMTRADGSATALTTPFSYVSGDSDTDGKLDVTEVWIYSATKVIEQEDIDAGGLVNSVTVEATDPFGTLVEDVSDNGNDADGNFADDPTSVDIIPGPAVDTVKTVLTAGAAAGDVVVFGVTVTNVGNVTLDDLSVTDAMTRADGTVIDPSLVTIVRTPEQGAPDSIAPGQAATWEVRYTLVQEDADAGGIANSATGSGTSPTGETVRDLSDDGDDADGNLTDDPTLLSVVPAPAFDVVKTIRDRVDPSARINAGEVVFFDIAVSNNGNVTLTELALVDTMTNAAGEVLTPDAIELTQGASETQVEVGETLIFTVTYTLAQADVDAGGIENTATVDVVTPTGVPISDTSDDGDDTDGNALDDPTVFVIEQVSSMEVAKEATLPERIGTDRFEVLFTITATNTGNVTQTDLDIRDDLAPFVAPATLLGVPGLSVEDFDGTGLSNPNYNGLSDTEMLGAGVDLAPGNTGTIVLTVTYDTTGSNFPTGTNTVELTSALLQTGLQASVSVNGGADPDMVAVKTATPSQVQLGSTVRYTLVFENRVDTTETNLTLVDDMPAGVVYTPGSARFNGSATPAPQVQGRRLVWTDVTLAPFGQITISFDARVVGEIGEMVNRAYILDGDGRVATNVATATVTRSPEAVFDCSDVIGTVFDDRNMNGYQDGAIAPDTSGISDQTFDGGKGKLTPAPAPQGAEHEPGLANARLVTVNGTVITTDEFGRFSVPCAELPAAGIGSNFTLKLDERSLPTGYRITTENPRTIRLTAGISAKMNFGAAISNVVDIDLMANAFRAGSTQPSLALAAGVDTLVWQLRDVPSVLRLSYYMNGEGRDVARARLDAVEAMIRDKWRTQGRYRLLIERTIRQLQ